MPRPVLLAAVWLLGVVLAVGTGLLAVRLVGDRVGDQPQRVLSLEEVASRASDAPTTTVGGPTPTTTPSTRPPAAATTGPQPTTSRPGTTAAPAVRPTARPTAPRPSASTAPPVTTSAPRTFAVPGGALSVRCRGTSAQLVYATPAQGWALDEQSMSGPEAEARFESTSLRSRIRVTCASGRPVEAERRVDENGGGPD